jgi:hypothetical protein
MDHVPYIMDLNNRKEPGFAAAERKSLSEVRRSELIAVWGRVGCEGPDHTESHRPL